jgi:triacylglycerol lipase
VIFSDWFGTQSGADVLVAVKGAAASVLKSPTGRCRPVEAGCQGQHQPAGHLYPGGERRQCLPDPAGRRAVPAAEQKDAIAAAFGDGTPLNNWPQATKVYSGTVKLPYFLSSPATAGSWDKAKTQSWHGAIPSLYAIANALKARMRSDRRAGGRGRGPGLLATLIADPSRQAELLAEASKLIGVTLTSGGKPLDAEQNIGRFNPLPMLEEVQLVPMRIFAKDDLNTITDVIIYQHGVTSVKENAYALALSQIYAGMQAARTWRWW